MKNMTQEERLNYLVEEFKTDSGEYKDIETPGDTEGKKRLLRSLMIIRMPRSMPSDVIQVQDEYRDLLPPLKEVGASCSMTLSGQVSTGYPRRPGGSSLDITFYALSCFSFSNLRPSSRMFFAALISLSWN